MSKTIRAFLAAAAAVVVPVVARAQEAVAPASTGGCPTFDQFSAWILESIVFGIVGILVLIGAYYLWELITPYSVKDQLVKERNVAVGIVVAAFIIGTALVIAAAIRPA